MGDPFRSVGMSPVNYVIRSSFNFRPYTFAKLCYTWLRGSSADEYGSSDTADGALSIAFLEFESLFYFELANVRGGNERVKLLP